MEPWQWSVASMAAVTIILGILTFWVILSKPTPQVKHKT